MVRAYRLLAVVLTALVLAGTRAGAQQQIDQTHRLAALCQVWGLLKYYHPQVAERPDWDDVLIAAVPRFKAAGTRRAFDEEIVALIGEAGLAYVFREISVGIPRYRVPTEALTWIDTPTLFEPETRLLLRAIAFAHRPAPNHYVRSTSTSTRNPDFSGEQTYASPEYPDEGLRLLALFRYWNMVQYFFPYRDIMDRDWAEVLPELIPKFQRAADALEYHLAAAEMVASVNDTHAYISSSVLASKRGLRAAPVRVRLIEGRSVITKVATRLLDPQADLRVGDVITHIDGVRVETLRAAMRNRISASNEASLERNIHNDLVYTNEARLRLTLHRLDDQSLTVEVNTVIPDSVWYAELNTPTYPLSAILPGNVGYIHTGLLQVVDVPNVMAQLRDTRGLLFDLRTYPQNTFSTLTTYLIQSAKPFVKFTEPDYDYPGRFLWTRVYTVGPGADYRGSETPAFTYTGKVAVLVNQETQSAAEFSAMGFRAAGVTVIGSQTSGADGTVSRFYLPGGIYTLFSGIGVFYPDGTPTQRIGIVPDIVVKPTIQGVRDGRDEVLEAAVAFLR